jgi:hypothetical protein
MGNSGFYFWIQINLCQAYFLSFYYLDFEQSKSFLSFWLIELRAILKLKFTIKQTFSNIKHLYLGCWVGLFNQLSRLYENITKIYWSVCYSVSNFFSISMPNVCKGITNKISFFLLPYRGIKVSSFFVIYQKAVFWIWMSSLTLFSLLTGRVT